MDKYLYANAIFSKFSRDYIELKKDLSIRPSEMGVLNIITKRGGLYTPVMIAELLGVSKPMITSHIAVLEKKGYISKMPCEDDKRSFYIVPTDKAKELVDKAEQSFKVHLKKIEDRLGKENFDLLIELTSEAYEVLKDEKEKKEGNSNGHE